MKNNHKGFALIEGLLIILIIGALAGVGWYVYKNPDSSSGSDDVTFGSSTPEATAETTQQLTCNDSSTLYENQELGLSFCYPNEWGMVEQQIQEDNNLHTASKIVQFEFTNSAMIISGNEKYYTTEGRGGSYGDYGGFYDYIEGDKKSTRLLIYDGTKLETDAEGYSLNKTQTCIYKNDSEDEYFGPHFHATCNLNSSQIYGINFYIDSTNTDITYQQFTQVIDTVTVSSPSL